jgi:hypothetical protein
MVEPGGGDCRYRKSGHRDAAGGVRSTQKPDDFFGHLRCAAYRRFDV